MIRGVRRRTTDGPVRLTRDTIAAAAERIVRADGFDALTMRRLAVELGTSTVAVYRHIEDKDELLVLLLDRLTARRQRPPLPDDPRDRLLLLWREMHDGLARYPWMVDVLTVGRVMAPESLRILESVHSSFAACGLSPEQVAAAWRVVWTFTVGELAMRHGRHQAAYPTDGCLDPLQEEALSTIDSVNYPTVAAQAPYSLRARTVDTYDDDVALVIDGVIGGLLGGVGAAVLDGPPVLRTPEEAARGGTG